MIKEVNLIDVCDVIAGQSPPSSTYNQDGNGMPFFQGKADFGKTYPTVRYWCNEPKKISKPNDILFSVRAPVGPTNINNIDACIGRGIAAIRCKNIEFTYLLHFLRGNEEKIASMGTGSTFKAITIGTLKKLKIPLPPLDQQKKIAAILDTADAYRQKTKALIDKYDELTQALFLDMFGDPVTNPKDYYFPKLKEVCKVSQGMQIAIKHRHKESGPNRFKYLTISYLNGRKDKEFIENPRNSVVCGFEDILMTRTGNTGQVITNVEGVFHNNFFKVDWNRDKLNKTYFTAFLSHAKIRQELLKRASTTTIPDLNHGQFYDLNVIVPSKELQNQFAERVKAIEGQKAQAQASLAHADNLFNSLLQRAFKGEVV